MTARTSERRFGRTMVGAVLAAALASAAAGRGGEPGAAPPPVAKTEPARGGTPVPADAGVETPASRAVDRALEFLRSTQEPDGSWTSGIGKSTGIVSLATMAFLSRGHVPGRGKYGDTLDRAIAWVLQQSREGMIIRDTSHGPMYCHGMSTLMLGEVLGMVNEERKGFEALARVHQGAVNLILRAQNV